MPNNDAVPVPVVDAADEGVLSPGVVLLLLLELDDDPDETLLWL